jgi:hypothetical protein
MTFPNKFLALPIVVAFLLGSPQCGPKRTTCERSGGQVVIDWERYDWVAARSWTYRPPTKCVKPG